MFLEAQGHHITNNVFAQDNQSAMKLEMNGRASCGQKSRHINIRYFFMKDRLKTEHIKVVHCPTEQMLADFFTKPLQGSLFEKFKRVLMGHDHVSVLSPPPLLSSTEERVENRKMTRVSLGENRPPEENERRCQNVQDTSDVTKATELTEPTELTGDDWTVVHRPRNVRINAPKKNQPRVHSFFQS